MPRWPLCLVLLAAASGCVTRHAGGPGAELVPVLVINESPETLRVTAEGSTTLRILPNKRGCLAVRVANGSTSVVAFPIGGVNETSITRGAVADNPLGGASRSSGTTEIRSPSFNPAAAPGWEWTLGATVQVAQTSLRPTETPCTP